MIKVCIRCGKRYNKKNGKFCSVECFGESLKAYRPCPICGTLFSGPRKIKTCSKACQYKSFEGSGNPMYKTGLLQGVCAHCSALFTYNKSNRSGKFCSQKCAHASPEWRNNMSISKTQSTHGIPDKVHKARIRASVKYNEWRLSVFKRDNYKCTKCGGNENIQVHHIIPFSVLFKEIKVFGFKDFRPLFDIDNGTTLCEPCHLLTDSYACMPIEMHLIKSLEKIFKLEPDGHKTFESYYAAKMEAHINDLKSVLEGLTQ